MICSNEIRSDDDTSTNILLTLYKLIPPATHRFRHCLSKTVSRRAVPYLPVLYPSRVMAPYLRPERGGPDNYVFARFPFN